MKKGIPAVQSLGRPARPLETALEDSVEAADNTGDADAHTVESGKDLSEDINIDENENADNGLNSYKEPQVGSRIVPPTKDEYIWMWKVRRPLILYVFVY